MLQTQAGPMQLPPMAENPIERAWFVVHRPAQRLPDVAAAFQCHPRLRGQYKIDSFLNEREASSGPQAEASAR